MGKSGSGFKYRSTAEDVTEGVDATGLTAIVTGATSGIGTETARVLALRGARVFIAGRSVESASKTKESLLKDLPNAKLDILAPLDLTSLASVKAAAERFLALDRPLNILINNAGVMTCPYALTVDGIETQFGTNHIGHFLLANLLLPKLTETANRTGIESRIVILSSAAIALATKDGMTWTKVNEEKGYSPIKAYGLSKIANVFHAEELARRLQAEGVTNVIVNSCHPGLIRTNLGRHVRLLLGVFYAVSFAFWKDIPQGAATTSYLALNSSVKGVSGKFFADSNEYDPKKYNKQAGDEQTAKALWELSEQLTSKYAN